MSEDTPPKLARDLVEELSKEVPAPRWPTTAGGATSLNDEQIRQNIWFAAQRALIDSLVALYGVEEAEQEDEDDPAYWTGDNGPRIVPAADDMVAPAVYDLEELDSSPTE